MLEATLSLEPLLEAKYARPPLTEPLRLGELGLLKDVVIVLPTSVSPVISVKSEVDFRQRHLWTTRNFSEKNNNFNEKTAEEVAESLQKSTTTSNL